MSKVCTHCKITTSSSALEDFVCDRCQIEIDCQGKMNVWRNAYMGLQDATSQEFKLVEQTLGKALGYPYFADDPQHYPDTTVEDGVCIGNHTAVTLSLEAASRIQMMEMAYETLWRKFAHLKSFKSESMP